MSKYVALDKFGIDKIGREDYLKKQSLVTKACKCAGCPSFVKGDAVPGGYCYPLIGTSKVIQWEKDCICASCSIYKEYDLTHTHYCTRCSSVCQSMKGEGGLGQGGAG